MKYCMFQIGLSDTVARYTDFPQLVFCHLEQCIHGWWMWLLIFRFFSVAQRRSCSCNMASSCMDFIQVLLSEAMSSQLLRQMWNFLRLFLMSSLTFFVHLPWISLSFLRLGILNLRRNVCIGIWII